MTWLQQQSEYDVRVDGGAVYPYNLSEVFPDVADPYRYWRELDYSQFSPLDRSVDALRELSNYFDIVFVSQAKGHHAKSKYYWLEEHFPFLTGVILTKEKWILNDSLVAMIDDRLEHLVGFDEGKRILFDTNYAQTIDCPVDFRFNKWDNSVVEKIINSYKE